jgi:hypothetical protein
VAEDGWLAPSTLSLLFVTFTFVLAGLLHPQELVHFYKVITKKLMQLIKK